MSEKSASENARAPERRSAIGSRLRANRTMRHLTLRELARRVGVSPSLISQIETGRSQPSVGTLYAIATELEVSVDDLLFDGDDARPDRRPGAPARATTTAQRAPARCSAQRLAAPSRSTRASAGSG